MFLGIKSTYFLMYIFFLPLFIEMPFIPSLWLKQVPVYTVELARLALLDVLIYSTSYQLDTLVHATGHIKLCQIIAGSVQLLNLPFSLIVLRLKCPVDFVMIVAIFLTSIVVIIKAGIVQNLIGFLLKRYVTDLILPLCAVSISAMFLPLFIYLFLAESTMRFLTIVLNKFTKQ
jgi:hypothetical protein